MRRNTASGRGGGSTGPGPGALTAAGGGGRTRWRRCRSSSSCPRGRTRPWRGSASPRRWASRAGWRASRWGRGRAPSPSGSSPTRGSRARGCCCRTATSPSGQCLRPRPGRCLGIRVAVSMSESLSRCLRRRLGNCHLAARPACPRQCIGVRVAVCPAPVTKLVSEHARRSGAAPRRRRQRPSAGALPGPAPLSRERRRRRPVTDSDSTQSH